MSARLKTPFDQLTILFKLLNKSPLTEAITGKVRKLKRPIASVKEDVVINSLPLDTSQVQQGVANVNIHVADLEGLQNEPNLTRLEELTALVLETLDGIHTQEYSLKVVRQLLVEEPAVKSSYMNLRIEFQFFPQR